MSLQLPFQPAWLVQCQLPPLSGSLLYFPFILHWTYSPQNILFFYCPNRKAKPKFLLKKKSISLIKIMLKKENLENKPNSVYTHIQIQRSPPDICFVSLFLLIEIYLWIFELFGKQRPCNMTIATIFEYLLWVRHPTCALLYNHNFNSS